MTQVVMAAEDREPPSVTECIAALKRLEQPTKIRAETGMEHHYPRRLEDEDLVREFQFTFGELPPTSYWKAAFEHLKYLYNEWKRGRGTS